MSHLIQTQYLLKTSYRIHVRTWWSFLRKKRILLFEKKILKDLEKSFSFTIYTKGERKLI